MAAANPDTGAFSIYTAIAKGPTGRCHHGLAGLAVLDAACAGHRGRSTRCCGPACHIFPVLPVWLRSFVFIVVLTAVDMTSVKNFGELEC